MDDKKKIGILRKIHGNHTHVAFELGITPRHYRLIRSGKIPIRKTISKLMDFLIEAD